MERPRIAARLRYEFDKIMAAGPIALIGLLFVLSIGIVAIAATLIALTGIQPADGDELGFVEAFWQSLMRTLDPGTMGDDQGWGFRLVMLAVTFTGVLIVASLIGVILTGLTGQLEQLRKGRSLVLERDHTIIFNWSETIFDVISQLVIANESRHRPCIVIMANRDKVAMEEEIAAKVVDCRNTRIICRTGDPTDLYDIGIANPATCRSVIILSPDQAEPDACVIKTILALVTDPQRRKARYRIAAEIRDSANAEVARTVGGDEVQLVLADDLIARVIVRSTRQPGLSGVYTELLDFEGCEVYAVEQAELRGQTYGEALFDYEECSPIGVCDAEGHVKLNPPKGHVLGKDEKLLLIAEDDSRIVLTDTPEKLGESPHASPPPPAPPPERTLLIGWNRRAQRIIRELARFVGPGSQLTIAADLPGIEPEIERTRSAAGGMAVEFKRIDACQQHEIAGLDPMSFDHILLLGYSDHLGAHTADTRTLITLLHLRSLRSASLQRCDVVSEINDVRNIALAELADVDDLVVSDRMIGLILAQASENPFFAEIFRDLLNEQGSEIALRPASTYVSLGQELDFYEVIRAAAARDETAIGQYLGERPSDAEPVRRGASLNPTKTERRRYEDADRIVVLARH